MKKPILIGIVAIAIIASFVTCSKENVSSKLPAVQPQQISTCLDYLDLVCNDAIPYYSTIQDFEDAYECLEDDYETYNDAYEAQFPTLDDDDYDDQVESDNFNEEEPLDDYEATYYYTSLRTTLNTAENTWLSNGMTGPDPFEHAVADFIFMTLLSVEGDVQIGGTLYHFAADGTVIEVSNADCQELADAKADPEYTSQYVTRIHPSNEECRNSDMDFSETPYSQNANRKFYWRIDFDSYINRSRAKTLARNFRYKNGEWKRAPAQTYVYIGGDVWDGECDVKSTISYNDKMKKRKRVMTKRWLATRCFIKEEQVRGLVEAVDDGAYIDETIDWQ